ncbi:HNH endonuclease [Xenorhabdus bovienii]|uniref:HNH endonuclease signature motif containing protein n=1 Tax=Xenorhabdus bovienii TaxID=40576 RepID=UPI002A6D5E5F|nr:HNH endonuclease [Xenorhabdus bovienii]
MKLANGKWRQKHRVIWEARHGEIPKNKYIIFKDGNARNCEINNLIMVSYAENIILNRFYHAIPEIYKQTAINLARIKIAIANKEK